MGEYPMRLYKGYSPKNVNPYWIVTYNIFINQSISANYTVSISSSNKLFVSLGTFQLFPELYTQTPIGVPNEATQSNT